jgi:hypothetical protein
MPVLNPSQINPQALPWLEWMNGAVQDDTFIADRVFRETGAMVALPKEFGQSVTFYQQSPQNYLGNPLIDLRRASGADLVDLGLRRGNWIDQFQLPEYAPFLPVDRQEIRAGFAWTDLAQERLLQVAMGLKIDREVRFAQNFGNTNIIPWATSSYANIPATFGGGAGGFAQLSDTNPATGAPISALNALKASVRGNAHGLRPNTLILTHRVAQCLAMHNQVLGATPAGTAASAAFKDVIITSYSQLCERLSFLLDIPHVYVFEALRRTNNLGQAVATEAFIDSAGTSNEWFWMGVMGAQVQAMSGVGGVKILGGGVVEAVAVEDRPEVLELENRTGFRCTIESVRAYCELGRFRSTSNPVGAETVNNYGYLVTDVMA